MRCFFAKLRVNLPGRTEKRECEVVNRFIVVRAI